MDVQQVLKEQDEQIDDIGNIMKRIRNNAKMINKELDHQSMYFNQIFKIQIKINKGFR